MGTFYNIYVEAYVNNKWRCIDGYYPHKPYGKDEYTQRLYSLYENGSRSYFGDTYLKLREIGNLTKFSDLSEEIQNFCPELKYEYYWGDEADKDREEACYTTVPVKVFQNAVPKGFSNHGVIHKDYISAYETHEMDEIWEDDKVDWDEIPEIKKQCYQYYEWDNRYEWQYYFKHINEFVNHEIMKYKNNEWTVDDPDFRLVVIAT